MRESWTDARLDDFRDDLNRRFDKVDKRFDNVERRMDEGFKELNTRFDALNRTLLQISGGVIATLIAGFFGVIVTQL